jgi:hypothetical protein
MSRQVWGTFSVKDHSSPHAFVAEVMLYDRLVIPVPPDTAERDRWEKEGWDPAHQEKLLTILGERAYPLNWDAARQSRWRTRFEAGTDVAMDTGEWAFAATRTVLTENLPPHVTGVQAITNYTSLEELTKELSLKAVDDSLIGLPGGTVTAILGHEFLVPDDPRWTHEDLLKAAVDLSSERTFRRKRASFWRWQREFLDDKGITDQSAIRDAVEEMQDLLEEERALVRKAKIRTGIQFAFLVGSVVLGMVGEPLTAVGIGGAFVSVGEFVAERILRERAQEPDTPVALLRDTRKHFGWR